MTEREDPKKAALERLEKQYKKEFRQRRPVDTKLERETLRTLYIDLVKQLCVVEAYGDLVRYERRALRVMSHFYAHGYSDLSWGIRETAREVAKLDVRWDPRPCVETRSARLELAAAERENFDIDWWHWTWLEGRQATAWDLRGRVAAYGALSQWRGRAYLIVNVLGREVDALRRAVDDGDVFGRAVAARTPRAGVPDATPTPDSTKSPDQKFGSI